MPALRPFAKAGRVANCARSASVLPAFALPANRCFNGRAMHFFVQRSELRDLYDKVAEGRHISRFAGSGFFCSN
jgi:hypothetical protein